MKAYPLYEVAKWLDGQILEQDACVLCSGVQIDSRRVQPGDLFFALPGVKVNGHQFLQDARERGAVAAVISREASAHLLDNTLPFLIVENVLAALQHLARLSYQEMPTLLLGITGSVGKTTTKEMAAVLLQGAFCVGKNPGSYNSQATYPLNFLNRTGAENLLVCELGMSRPGEIGKLISIAAPDLALITKVSLAHAANFPDGLEGIARAKREICAHDKTKRVIVDFEALPFFQDLKQEVISFSLHHRAADYYLYSSEGRYWLDERGVRMGALDVPFTQTHLLHDLLGAIAASRLLGVSWDEIGRRTLLLERPKMRFEVHELGGVTIVNDAYNASPASVRAALENLPLPREGGKRIGVLGSMLELGMFSQQAHEEAGHLAARYLDVLLCVGEEAKCLYEAFHLSKKTADYCATSTEACARLQELLCPGDVVLLKGSRAMGLETILQQLLDATQEAYVAAGH